MPKQPIVMADHPIRRDTDATTGRCRREQGAVGGGVMLTIGRFTLAKTVCEVDK